MPGVELKLGEKLEIMREEKRAVSTIESITKNGRMIISEPMHGLGRLPLKKNDKIDISVFRESGILAFAATAERIIQERGLTFIELEIRSKINRHQRRNYVRFDTVLPMSVSPLYDQDALQLTDRELVTRLTSRRLSDTPIPEGELIGCTTLDISGGGVRFFCKNELVKGASGDCEILLKDGSLIEASMRILRCEHELYEGHYVMGAKFIGIQEALRERIIKYIFSEQLKQRRGS
jgi:c-di-GMP-binding flagellar brake protein YcgR